MDSGIWYFVLSGVDGIGLVLIALAATLVPIVVIAGWRDVDATSGDRLRVTSR